MNRIFLHKHEQTPDTLAIFFAGWGFDATPFADYTSADDILLCCDYSDVSFDAGMLAPYRNIRVVAWSMGVWAASVVAEKIPRVTTAVAVNGTTTPVNDDTGIPCALFRKTLDGLSEQNLLRFYRHICGDPATLARFLEMRPTRSLDDLRAELAAIETLAAQHPGNAGFFTDAVVCERDMIFPPANQLRAWQCRVRSVSGVSHYPPELLRRLVEGRDG